MMKSKCDILRMERGVGTANMYMRIMAYGSRLERSKRMRDELMRAIEQEVLSWPGMTSEAFPGPFEGTSFRFGKRDIGHVHHEGAAHLPFPRLIYDEVVSSGRAHPHPMFPKGFVEVTVHGSEDVAVVVDLFRMNYERARGSAERRSPVNAN